MNYPSTHQSLLEKIQNGDEVSWNEFYQRYSPIIRYVGHLYHFNENECDDLIQNVMLKFFSSSKKFVYRKGEVKFRTYFASIIRSQAVDHIRKNAARSGNVPEMTDRDDSFDELFFEEWKKFMLEESLDELRQRVDPRTYQAFELYALQHRDISEIAAIPGFDKNMVYVAKSRCMKMLREIIERKKKFDGDLNLEI